MVAKIMHSLFLRILSRIVWPASITHSSNFHIYNYLQTFSDFRKSYATYLLKKDRENLSNQFWLVPNRRWKRKIFCFDLVMSIFSTQMYYKAKKVLSAFSNEGKVTPNVLWGIWKKLLERIFFLFLVMPLLLNQMNCERERF